MGLDIQGLFKKMAGEQTAVNGRRDAVRDLELSWSRDPAMLEWMAERSEFKCEAFVRKLAEQEMSLSDEVMSGTLIWLMRRAFFNTQERLRRDALIEIMRVWWHRPNVNIWVVEMTEEEENRHIRDTVLEHISKMEHLDDKTRHDAERKLAVSKASHARHRNLKAGLGRTDSATRPEEEPPDSPTGMLFSNN